MAPTMNMIWCLSKKYSTRKGALSLTNAPFWQCCELLQVIGNCVHYTLHARPACSMWLIMTYVENINHGSSTTPLKCGKCYKQFGIGQLLIKFTGPEVWWCHFSNGCSHHVDCVWPTVREVRRRNVMMANKEVKQIKLELNKCQLEGHDIELLHSRLDAMADNHNSYMYSII